METKTNRPEIKENESEVGLKHNNHKNRTFELKFGEKLLEGLSFTLYKAFDIYNGQSFAVKIIPLSNENKLIYVLVKLIL